MTRRLAIDSVLGSFRWPPQVSLCATAMPGVGDAEPQCGSFEASVLQSGRATNGAVFRGPADFL